MSASPSEAFPRRRTAAHPLPMRAPATTLNVTARELERGVWILALESRGQPGVAHELAVAHGVPAACDCPGARYGPRCRHRDHAAQIAGHLDDYLAARATLAEIARTGDAGNDKWRERSRADYALAAIGGLGYRVAKLEALP